MRSRLQPRRTSGAVLVAAALAAGGCGTMRSCASPPPRPDGRYLYVVARRAGLDRARRRPAHRRLQGRSGDGGPARRRARHRPGRDAVGAFSLAVDPSGRWFSLAGSQLGLLRVTASGAVEPAMSKPAAGLSGYFDARGRFYFLVTGQGLNVFRLDARRGVDLSTPLHTEAGVLAFVMGGPRDGSLLYAGGEDFRVYTVGEHGALAAAPGSPHALPVRALELAVHPSGRFVLVFGEARGHRLIAVLRAGADGSLEEVAGSPFNPGNDARSMALSADGAFVFVTDRDRHSIETLGLDAGGGLHAVASTPMDVPEAGYLVGDAQSRYLYAGNMKAGTVEAFAIEASGALTPVPGSPFAVGPRTGALVSSPLADGPIQAAALPEADAFAGRPAAVRADASTFATASLDTLVDALGDSSDDTRYFAMAALARRTDPRRGAAGDSRGAGRPAPAGAAAGRAHDRAVGTGAPRRRGRRGAEPAGQRQDRARRHARQRQPHRAARAEGPRRRGRALPRPRARQQRPAPRGGDGGADRPGTGRRAGRSGVCASSSR